MFSVRHNGKSYQVLFRLAEGVLRIGKKGFEKVDDVLVQILDENLRTVGHGHAIKAERDDFDDVVGMKLALARALKYMPDKALRAKFHEAFQNALVGEMKKTQAKRLAELRVQRGTVTQFPIRRVADVRV